MHAIKHPVITPAVPVIRKVVVRPLAEPQEYPAAERAFILNPNVDYGRVLTQAGGIGFFFKDIDTQYGHGFWQFLAWAAVSSVEAWVLLNDSPMPSVTANVIALVIALIFNALIVFTTVEVYRTIEIRHDCMIIEGSEVFYAAYMNLAWPSFRFVPETKRWVLTGVYGTRAVEFLSIGYFDENDRAPEVLARQIQEAMQQLWGAPQGAPRRS